MFYIENQYKPSDYHLNMIDHIMSDGFPWFYQYSTNMNPKFMYYGHVLLSRNSSDPTLEGIVNSNFYDDCFSLFKDFCNTNKIEVSKVYRACLNSTFYIPEKMGEIHKDLPFDHKVFIMYLNEFDEGQTKLYDNNNILIKTIQPQKFKGVVFSDTPHTNSFCSPFQRRVVMVFNFN
jgi:hypothetical protein